MTRERRDGRRPFAERLRDWRCLAAAPKEFDRRPRGVKTAQAAHGLVSVTGTPPGSSGLPRIHLPKLFTYPNVATPYHAFYTPPPRIVGRPEKARGACPPAPVFRCGLRFDRDPCGALLHGFQNHGTNRRAIDPGFRGRPSLARQKTRRDARNGCARWGRFVSSEHVCSRPSRTIPGRSLGRPVRRRAGQGDRWARR